MVDGCLFLGGLWILVIVFYYFFLNLILNIIFKWKMIVIVQISHCGTSSVYCFGLFGLVWKLIMRVCADLLTFGKYCKKCAVLLLFLVSISHNAKTAMSTL
jgi:hypothetical protein